MIIEEVGISGDGFEGDEYFVEEQFLFFEGIGLKIFEEVLYDKWRRDDSVGVIEVAEFLVVIGRGVYFLRCSSEANVIGTTRLIHSNLGF